MHELSISAGRLYRSDKTATAPRDGRLRLAWLVLGLLVLPDLDAAAQSNTSGIPRATGLLLIQGASEEPLNQPLGFPRRPYASPVTGSLPQRFGGQPYQPQDEQPPQQQSPAMTIQQYLIGLWHGDISDNDGRWNVDVTFRRDSTFTQQQTLRGGQFQLALRGRYNAQLGENGGVIVFSPQQWEPRQICQETNNCQPIDLPSSISIQFTMVSRDEVQTENGTYQRIVPPC